MPAIRACGLLLIVLSGGACTERQLYDSAAGWRQTECNKILDDTARTKCMETANQDYDRYRRQL